MKKKRVILCVTNDISYDQRMQKTAVTLIKNGFEVLIIGRKKKNSAPLTDEVYAQHRLNCWFEKGKLFYLEFNLRLFLFLVFQSTKYITAVDLDTAMAVWAATRFKQTTILYDAHEYFPEVPEVVNRKTVKKIWEWVEQFTIKKFNKTYTVCDSIANVFSAKYERKIDVIYNYPRKKTTENFTKKNKSNILLYQGALNDGRGLEQLITAMKNLPNLECWIVGEGDLSEQLRTLVKKLNTEHTVRFLGYKKPAELKEITAQAWLGINLLENKGLNYYYSLANKFFDYIQVGIPCLNMDFPEYRKFNTIFETSVLLSSLNSEAIVHQIQLLQEDDAKYNTLQENCKKATEYWIWEQQEEKILELYA